MQFTDDEGRQGGDDPLLGSLVAARAILDNLPDAVVAAARDGRIVYVNALAEELFGYARAELIGRPVQLLWPERVRERYTRNMELYFATEHPLRFSVEAWGLRQDGSVFVGEMSWGIVGTTGGPLLLAVGRDISERRAGEARARAVAAMGERALAGATPSELGAEVADALCSVLPVSSVELRIGPHVLVRRSGVAAGDGGGVHLAIGTSDELTIWPQRGLSDAELSFARAIANTLAMAIARSRDEQRMRYQAVHDPLTGLANRTLLRDRLEHAHARSRRTGGATGVVFIDLDNFKDVNDAYGHATGDAVLVEVARRLVAVVRPADTVARLGGDEFVVVSEQVDEPSTLALAQRLKETIERELAAGKGVHHLRASIGVALGRADPDTLLGSADTALYRAKAQGGGRVELFA